MVSDAYYGDESSVLQLYRKRQNPMIMQDINRLKENDNQLFLCSYVCNFIDDRMILISEMTNAVIQLSKIDWVIKAVDIFQDELYAKELCLMSFVVDNKVIGIPYNAVDFNVIDLSCGERKKIVGCVADSERNKNAKFLTTIVCGKHVWVCGENIKRIIGIDINTLVPFANISFSDIHGLEDIADIVTWGFSFVVRENYIFLAGRNCGVILEINDLTCEATVRIRTSIQGFSCFYEYDGQMLLIDQSGNEYQCNIDQNCIVKTGRKFDDACWKCIVVDNRRYYFETFSGRILCIFENKIKEILYENCQNLAQFGVKFQFVVQDGKYIYFQERFSGRIFILNTDTDKCIQKEINILDDVEEWKRKTIEQSIENCAGCYVENSFISVEDLLKYLCSRNEKKYLITEK